MSNQWLNDLRNKMEDHESDVPEGLWDDIKDELFNEEDKKIIGLASANDLEAQEKIGSTIRGKKLVYRIGSIAAVFAMFFVGNQLFKLYNEKPVSKKITQSKKIDIIENVENENSLNNPKEMIVSKPFDEGNKNQGTNFLNGMSASTENILSSIGNKERKVNEDLNFENQSVIAKENQNEKNNQIGKEEIASMDNGQPLNENKDLLSKEEKEFRDKFESIQKTKLAKNQSKKPWMLSLLAGNTSGGSTEQFPGYANLDGSSMNIGDMWLASEDGENALAEVLLANQNEEVKARVRHKVPVTFGLSMYYSLSKRWGIGIGLNYTKLSSELRTGSNESFIKSDQAIHYIGVPIQVNYNVIQKGVFTGYVAGGVIVEKPISGSVTTKYIVNNEVKEESREGLDTKPIQFSVNTALGLQMKVAKKIGIYAEPGIGYHFKDDSSLNTIYKEKPFNFNVKFGIRLLID